MTFKNRFRLTKKYTYYANCSVEPALVGHWAIAFLESTFQASAEIPEKKRIQDDKNAEW